MRLCAPVTVKALESKSVDCSVEEGHEPNARVSPSAMAGSADGVEGGGPRGLEEGLQEDAAVMAEDRRHLQEVRVDEQQQDPLYGAVSLEGPAAEHGSHGNHVESSALQQDSTSDGQPALASSREQQEQDSGAGHGAGGDGPATARARSMERREEDVGQISRSLNFMTGLLSTLVGRVDRMEQWQSVNGSVGGRAPMSTEEGSQPTPTAMTPATAWSTHRGLLDADEVELLQQQLSQVSVGQGGPEPEFQRPLASLEKVMAGTFSSDGSETARRRAAEGGRGVPGRLLGPLADSNLPVQLHGNPGTTTTSAMEPSRMSSLQQALESQRMSLLQQAMGSPGMSSLQQATGLQSMSSLQQAMEFPGMSSLQQAMESPGMSSLQQAMESPRNVLASTGFRVSENVLASTGFGVSENVIASTGIGVSENVIASTGRKPAAQGLWGRFRMSVRLQQPLCGRSCRRSTLWSWRQLGRVCVRVSSRPLERPQQKGYRPALTPSL